MLTELKLSKMMQGLLREHQLVVLVNRLTSQIQTHRDHVINQLQLMDEILVVMRLTVCKSEVLLRQSWKMRSKMALELQEPHQVQR